MCAQPNLRYSRNLLGVKLYAISTDFGKTLLYSVDEGYEKKRTDFIPFLH